MGLLFKEDEDDCPQQAASLQMSGALPEIAEAQRLLARLVARATAMQRLADAMAAATDASGGGIEQLESAVEAAQAAGPRAYSSQYTGPLHSHVSGLSPTRRILDKDHAAA